jgi:hypothetical protein
VEQRRRGGGATKSDICKVLQIILNNIISIDPCVPWL